VPKSWLLGLRKSVINTSGLIVRCLFEVHHNTILVDQLVTIIQSVCDTFQRNI
jgi:hypothetical protein